jgi:molybdate transport system substrate-binding protein
MRRPHLAFYLLFGAIGCAGPTTPDVTIFAAVSTKETLERVASDFQASTGTSVSCNFAGSSTLARQIEQGAAADLFLSADERWADELAGKDLVARRCDLLANRLVVVTPADAPLKMDRLPELSKASVKHVGVALDAVPVGHYAREALKKAGIWEEIQERVREAADVRQTLTLVIRKEVDAGFVYATDAAITDKVRVALEVPESLHPPIRYPLVLLRRPGRLPAKALAFYEYLRGEKAQSVFRQAGFQGVP